MASENRSKPKLDASLYAPAVAPNSTKDLGSSAISLEISGERLIAKVSWLLFPTWNPIYRQSFETSLRPTERKPAAKVSPTSSRLDLR